MFARMIDDFKESTRSALRLTSLAAAMGVAVFIALAFWTWLWGPMGGFLSSPLLIVALIVRDHLWPPTSPQLP